MLGLQPHRQHHLSSLAHQLLHIIMSSPSFQEPVDSKIVRSMFHHADGVFHGPSHLVLPSPFIPPYRMCKTVCWPPFVSSFLGLAQSSQTLCVRIFHHRRNCASEQHKQHPPLKVTVCVLNSVPKDFRLLRRHLSHMPGASAGTLTQTSRLQHCLLCNARTAHFFDAGSVKGPRVVHVTGAPLRLNCAQTWQGEQCFGLQRTLSFCWTVGRVLRYVERRTSPPFSWRPSIERPTRHHRLGLERHVPSTIMRCLTDHTLQRPLTSVTARVFVPKFFRLPQCRRLKTVRWDGSKQVADDMPPCHICWHGSGRIFAISSHTRG